MKVFGIGLQRTGTMSLAKALNILQIKTLHWPWQLLHDSDHEVLREFDGFVDFPIPLMYKKLDVKYPSSKFILTVRDKNSWLGSVQWLFTTGRVIDTRRI